jgi:8-hydroxy-5-deazaflavin:NADPH oxidoreductase
MKVTIIGAGNMGRGIGTRAVAGGHEVEILDRDPAEAQKLAAELGGSTVALDPGAPFGGDVVVFAVYYPGIKDAVRQYADRLEGKVVVDITNPVDTETWDGLATTPGSSSAEEIAHIVPEGASVVKAFNTTFAATLAGGEVDGQQLDVLMAGDDEEAKQKVSPLVSDGGLRPVDVGPFRRAQQLEHLGFLHISLQQPLDLGFGYVPVERRVLRRLVELAQTYGDGVILLTQEVLAEMAGTTRATVNQVLRAEQERGTVELRRGKTIVLDRDGLARRAR